MYFPQKTLKPDYVPAKNERRGESCLRKLINLSHFRQPQAQTHSCVNKR